LSAELYEPDADELESEQLTDEELDFAAERWWALQEPDDVERWRREAIALEARAAMHRSRGRQLVLLPRVRGSARPRERRPRRLRRARSSSASRDGPDEPEPEPDVVVGPAPREAAA
jgi:hypothetical protein